MSGHNLPSITFWLTPRLCRELTKLHEQLFHRGFSCSTPAKFEIVAADLARTGEPLVASVWRRQTFSAAVDSLDPEMSLSLFREHMSHVFSLINPSPTIAPELEAVLDASYVYSRMLHKSYSPGGALEGSGFYRSFVCQVGSPLDPTQLGASFHRTLVHRCLADLSTSRRTDQEVLSYRAR